MTQLMPGEMTSQEKKARMIRVNHAGEYGALRIYEGQLRILGKSPKGDLLRHMLAQEKEHLEKFEKLIIENRVRPTLLSPLWHGLGYALGALTATMGEKTAMACTVAVEEVIDDHYAKQEQELPESELDFKTLIHKCREEESEHRDIGLANGAEQATAYPLLKGAIKAGTKLAIWLSERV